MVLIPLGVFILYFFTQSRFIFGGDSAEFALISKIGGIAHPPGYPLFSLIQHTLYNTLSFLPDYIRFNIFSIICTSFSTYLLYKIIHHLHKSKFIAGICAALYSSVYLIWLYSIVPEIYAYHLFLLIATTYLVLLFIEKPTSYLRLSIYFLVGLGLSHHQSYILFIPGWIFLLWKQKKSFFTHGVLGNIAIFALAWIPFIYAPLTSIANHPLDWENAKTIDGFFRLVTRASYGTFSAYATSKPDLVNQTFNVLSLLYFFLQDLKPVGTVIFIISLFVVPKYSKKVAAFLNITFFLYLVFIFLSNFDLASSFIIGVFERYLIGLYFIAILTMSFGIRFLMEKTTSVFRKTRLKRVVSFVFMTYLFSYVCLSYIQTYRKIAPITTLKVFDNLGTDVLNTPQSKNTILSLSNDLPYFTATYFYYTSKNKPKPQLIFFGISDRAYYIERAKKMFPTLVFPYRGNKFQPDAFFEINRKNNDIIFETPYATETGYWAPYGLLWKYYSSHDELKKDIPTLLSINNKLWKTTYHIPKLTPQEKETTIAVGVEEYYLQRLNNYITFLISMKKYDEARSYLNTYIPRYPNNIELQNKLMIVLALQNDCKSAIDVFQKLSSYYHDEKQLVQLKKMKEQYCKK